MINNIGGTKVPVWWYGRRKRARESWEIESKRERERERCSANIQKKMKILSKSVCHIYPS